MTVVDHNKERIKREKKWHNSAYSKEKYIRADCGKYYAANKEANVFFVRAILNVLHKENSIVLDYGCGDGNSLNMYSPYFKYGYGIDISEMRIARARSFLMKNNVNNVDVHVMDAMNTDFEDHKFDVIYGTAILHHLDLNKALRELKRILKPNGNAIFFEPMGTNFLINLYRKLTPQSRTIDEQPFRKVEIDLILSYFPNSQFKYFSFFTLCAVPFRRFKFFDSMYRQLARWDRVILRKNSPFRGLAWISAINLRP